MGDVYTVQHIVKHRKQSDGTIDFLVKWQGYDASHNSWEPQANILDPTVLRSYAEKSGIDIVIEEEDETEYEVNKVLDVRTMKGRLEYKILWEAGDTTWEPADEFLPSEWDEVVAFWESRGEEPPPAATAVGRQPLHHDLDRRLRPGERGRPEGHTPPLERRGGRTAGAQGG